MPQTLFDLLPRDGDSSSDNLLGRFLDYAEGKRLTLYPAQEAAILELFEDKNVILNTPTGSGKSLVAAAMHFKSLAQGRRSVYTCPIKALVNEKWLGLCREFGPENVGLSTGDASVNRDAPILCCTAEVLANVALREGPTPTCRTWSWTSSTTTPTASAGWPGRCPCSPCPGPGSCSCPPPWATPASSRRS
jgi:superfamily II RNA helicase